MLSLDRMASEKSVLTAPVFGPDGAVFGVQGATGRTSLAREISGAARELDIVDAAGEPIDVGSRVHEYGGPALAIDGEAAIFSHRTDGRLYRVLLDADGSAALPITPDDGWRYADLQVISGHVICVAEIHDADHSRLPRHVIVDIDLFDGDRQIIYEGPDFIAGVRLSPSGEQICWYEWDLGQMPWDHTRVRVGERFETGIAEIRTLSSGSSSAIAPLFVTEDDVVFADDVSGWWNLYRAELGAEVRVRPLHPAEAEFAVPPWTMDQTFTVLDDDHLLVTWIADGHAHLGSMNWHNGELEEWLIGYEPSGQPAARDGRVLLRAVSATVAPVILAIDLPHATSQILRQSDPEPLPEEWISLPEAFTYRVAPIAPDSPEGRALGGGVEEHEAFGYFYPPHHPTVTGPEDAAPPLVVMVHGGPTSAALPTFADRIQFWTTRGFAVFDVNHVGSTGYGTAYRDGLRGEWGVVDAADIAAGVRALAERGLIDPTKAVIRGGSAGGFAVLRALTTSDVFAAGTSLYGVADLTGLVRETHMFESRYLDTLIGPYPEQEARYAERSPINHLERLTAPLLLLHGARDAVVPLAQATGIRDELAAGQFDVELVVYPEEFHGFRAASVRKDALGRELAFYRRVLDLT